MLELAVEARRKSGLEKAMRSTTDECEEDRTRSVVERDRSDQSKIFAVKVAEDIMIKLGAAEAPVLAPLVNAADFPIDHGSEETDAIEVSALVIHNTRMEEPLCRWRRQGNRPLATRRFFTVCGE